MRPSSLRYVTWTVLLVSLVAVQYALCNGRLVCVGAIGLVGGLVGPSPPRPGRPPQDPKFLQFKQCDRYTVAVDKSKMDGWEQKDTCIEDERACRSGMNMSKTCVSSYRNENTVVLSALGPTYFDRSRHQAATTGQCARLGVVSSESPTRSRLSVTMQTLL